MPLVRCLGLRCAFGFAVLTATLTASGQTPRLDLSSNIKLDEIDSIVKGHLQRTEALAANGRWNEVIETLRQIADTQGDRVTTVVPGYYVRLRDYCHRRLAALPPSALALYREQVDAQAEAWFAEAETTGDERPLRKIVDQLYCSSRGDDALRLLGDAALTRGDFGAARGYWEQLVESPPALVTDDDFATLRTDATLTPEQRQLLDRYYVRREAGKTHVLHARQSVDPNLPKLAALMRSRGIVGPRPAYPQSDLAPADVFARLILVDVLEGSSVWAEAGLRDLKSTYPEARGRLGGRDVNYADALNELLTQSKSWPRRIELDEWPTFAGNTARNRRQPVDFDVGRIRWRVPLTPVVVGEHDYPVRRAAEDRRTLLSYWPIVVDGKVFVADAVSVRGYDLATGEGAWGGESLVFEDRDAMESAFPTRSTLGVPRYTLTAHGERLFVRMGRTVTSAVVDGIFRGPTSYIMCFNLAAEGSRLWSITPPTDDGWAFEGTPVADDDFIYVALRKSGVRPQAHVACYDAETGQLQWRRMVCSAETPGHGQYDEITHNLLTLVGDRLYYNTNLGAVASLSKQDGEIRWIATYPRNGGGDMNRRSTHLLRDLTPCIYDRGTLIVAPSDSRHVLALDAACGLLRWETSLAEDAVHFLGVADDFLLASGERQWWIHALSGRIAYVWPDDSPKGFGRGAIVGDSVLRPTRTTIEVLGITDGLRKREIELTTRGAMGGNLIVLKDSLLVVGGDELIAFDRHGGTSMKAPSSPLSGGAATKEPKNPRVDE